MAGNGDGDKGSTPRVAMRARTAKQITAALITVTKNNQGHDKSAAYCLAALAGTDEGKPRLIRLVPDIGHFWSDEALPRELREMHWKPPNAPPSEPHFPFRPVIVGFEAGTLPDAVTGPHRMDDVVARKLEYKGEVPEQDKLYEQLYRMAQDNIDKIWPERVWATPKSLIPNSEVVSLAIFHGDIKQVHWRQQASPLVDVVVDGREVARVPYAAHRLHEDKGFAMLEWFQERSADKKGCLLLLGLSRTFQRTDTSLPQCPILLLRCFPCA